MKKNTSFYWSSECQSNFETLKLFSSSELVLLHLDFSNIFVLNTDGSDFKTGAVLSQCDKANNLRPICYTSRTLRKAEIKYGAIEKEASAILFASKIFRVYLLR